MILKKENHYGKAEQQFTGFIHRRKGYDLYSLALSMDLTAEEWGRMKKEAVWYEELSTFDVERIEDAVYSN